ncbi:MAG: hypothetical protein CMH48_04865 [Muricauda sp.]|jgi:hypothetical protein|nr:DUF3298 and DUF4163 domain-containing protein [Allomuricauda sp.]MAU27105.1 hypothetical protein [Allomuricauda sp.]MBC30159.1 hypothetical protein [Allomuricauda sp.]|tara:strand:- start:16278 stop:17021 length:744 start_codon:yes stop_codon:yes gene_type:complete
MKKPIALLALFMAFFGCEETHKLTFEPVAIESPRCAECPSVTIEIPEALDNSAVAKAINTALREEIIYHLKFDEGKDVATIEEAVASFTEGFHQIQQKFGGESAPWEAKIQGRVVYEDEHIITLSLNAYTFTGGAHGYGSTIFLNFDKAKGIELNPYQFFNDVEEFEEFAEAKFREQEKIPQEGNINQTGFMFEKNRFRLAENIAYTEEGLQIVYNQYEIASYADGPIVLTIPFDEANTFLKYKVKS